MLNASKSYFFDRLMSCKPNYLNFKQASLGAAPHMRACHHPLHCWRVSQRKSSPQHPHHFHKQCSWLGTSRKSKVHLQIIQTLSSLGFSFSYFPSLTKSFVIVNELFNSSWSNESMTFIIPAVLNAFEQLLVHMLPHSPWQELRLLAAANVLASKLWSRATVRVLEVLNVNS